MGSKLTLSELHAKSGASCSDISVLLPSDVADDASNLVPLPPSSFAPLTVTTRTTH